MSIISSLLTIKNYSAKKAADLLHIPENGKKLFIEKMNSGNCFFYAIVVLNKTLGRIILFTDLDDKDLADGKSVCYFSNLWVHPKLRGQKIGSKLVHYVEKQARKKGFEYLTLGVYGDNEKNMSIYKHLGFDIFVKNKTSDILIKNKSGEYITMKEHIILKKSIK